MSIARRLTPFALAALLMLPAAAPAQAQGLDAILQILTEVLRTQGQQESYEQAARRELEDERYRIERERERVVEDYEQRRWELQRRFEEERADIRRESRWRGERRRQVRALKHEYEERLRRLEAQERRRLNELDHRLVEAERRYEDRIDASGWDYDDERFGDIVRVLDVSGPR